MLKTIIADKDNIVKNTVNTNIILMENGLMVDDGSGRAPFIIARIEDYNVYENVEIVDVVVPLGKMIVRDQTTIDPVSKELTYVYEDIPISDSQKLLELQKSLNLLPPVINPVTLQDYKDNKIYEINVACNQTILGGFMSNCLGSIHQYKFDMEYQSNFAQQGVLVLMDASMENVMWPTKDMGVLPHARESFIQLCKDAQDWKSNNIYRYFGLKAQIENCTDISQVETFAW